MHGISGGGGGSVPNARYLRWYDYPKRNSTLVALLSFVVYVMTPGIQTENAHENGAGARAREACRGLRSTCKCQASYIQPLARVRLTKAVFEGDGDGEGRKGQRVWPSGIRFFLDRFVCQVPRRPSVLFKLKYKVHGVGYIQSISEGLLY